MRLPLIDLLKVIASQVIVLHHLVSYGPLSDHLHAVFPRFSEGLYHYGRWAPQVFLVVSGFLFARVYAPGGVWAGGALWQAWKQRYLRLVLPYGAALLFAVGAAAIVRPWLGNDPGLPPVPTWKLWWTHVLLVQNILHLESLSAGVWYIAIDFQLFLLMSVLLWLGRRWPAASLSLVALGMAASMVGFNRDDTLDDWAIYFFGSYGLGAMAYWLGKSRSRSSRWELAGVGALVAVALSLHFRGRLVLACGVAASLYFSGAWGSRPPGIVAYLSRISYALFLIHYPIVLLANRVCVQCEIQRPAAIALCALATWLASLLAAALFHHWIESPCIRSVSRSEKI